MIFDSSKNGWVFVLLIIIIWAHETGVDSLARFTKINTKRTFALLIMWPGARQFYFSSTATQSQQQQQSHLLMISGGIQFTSMFIWHIYLWSIHVCVCKLFYYVIVVLGIFKSFFCCCCCPAKDKTILFTKSYVFGFSITRIGP